MESNALPDEHKIESQLLQIEALLHQVIRHSRFDLKFSIQKETGTEQGEEALEYVVDFTGRDADLLLEKNASLLNALEYVVLKAARVEESHFGKFSFDCQDYRRLRHAELRLTAQVAAERVIESGDPFTLNPMSPRERRVIHLTLRDRPEVRTVSEGTGADRKVVIMPANSPSRLARR